MKCPRCLSKKTKVTDSRRKDAVEKSKTISVSRIPKSIRILDYTVRRHKCLDCGFPFTTVETYFDQDDIDSFLVNDLTSE